MTGSWQREDYDALLKAEVHLSMKCIDLHVEKQAGTLSLSLKVPFLDMPMLKWNEGRLQRRLTPLLSVPQFSACQNVHLLRSPLAALSSAFITSNFIKVDMSRLKCIITYDL